jgi:hypothetical protein
MILRGSFLDSAAKANEKDREKEARRTSHIRLLF